MSPEEAFAELERKVERIGAALQVLLKEVLHDAAAPDSVQIGAGRAWNILNGVEE